MPKYKNQLDLDQYRRVRNRLSTAANPAIAKAPCGTDEVLTRGCDSPSNLSAKQKQPQPPSTQTTSSRILHGILAGDGFDKFSITPKTDPIAAKRKQRFEKFRARSRESLSPAGYSVGEPRAGLVSQSQDVEGSPLRPIVLGEDQINKTSYQTREPSPISANRSQLSGMNCTAEVFPTESSLSSTRDRIEEARISNPDRTPFSELPATVARDPRIRMAANSSGRQSLTPKVSRRSHGGFSQSSRGDRDINVQSQCLSQDSYGGAQGVHSLIAEDAHTSKRGTSSVYDRNILYQSDDLDSKIPELDQRTVRLLYSKDFEAIIARHKKTNMLLDCPNENQSPPDDNAISCFVRKRAISKNEIDRGEFDVVSIGSNSVVVYKTEMKADLRTKIATPLQFCIDRAFSDKCPEEEFYLRVGQPLVLTAKNGGVATAIVIGQRGSGKGMTMADIEERAAYDVFEAVESNGGAHVGPPTSVAVQVVEFVGNECRDLLGNLRSPVKVVSDKGGTFRLRDAQSYGVASAQELLKILSDAKQRLVMLRNPPRAAGRHQSHVVCQIFVQQNGKRGILTLVECSSKAETDEIGETNYRDDCAQSFQALLEVIKTRVAGRARENSHIPYGSYSFTKLLQAGLESEGSRISVVATLSPKATDTEDTISTLRTLSSLVGARRSKTIAPSKCHFDDTVLPRQWGHEELGEWMSRKHLLGKPFPSNINGRMAMRMSKPQIKKAFYEDVDDAKAEKLYIALRAENDRIARIRVKRRIAREKEMAKQANQ